MEPLVSLILLVLSLLVHCLAFQARRILFSAAEEDLREIWPGQSLPLVLRLLKRPRRISLSLWLAQRISLLMMVLGSYKFLQTQGLQGALFSLLGVSVLALLGRNVLGPGRLGVDPMVFFSFLLRGAWLADAVLGPVADVLERGGKFLGGVLSARKGEARQEYLAQRDLLELVERGCHEGALEKEEHRMIHRVMGFKDRHVSRVMTPRADMFCLPVEMNLSEAAAAVREAGYSRVPVYRQNKDNVVGILFAKDLLRLRLPDSENLPSTLSDMLRPAFFVPVSMELGDLLEELKSRKLHMALCVDEYGSLSGLVTMEDILEELFGEIYDEYDLEIRRWEKMEDDVYMVSGKLGLHELEGLLDIRIKEQECSTVAGLVLKRLGHFPLQGEEVEVGKLKLRVEKVAPTRVLAVRVQLMNQEEP